MKSSNKFDFYRRYNIISEKHIDFRKKMRKKSKMKFENCQKSAKIALKFLKFFLRKKNSKRAKFFLKKFDFWEKNSILMEKNSILIFHHFNHLISLSLFFKK